MADETQPRLLIIAGPNGAGKSTFAQEFLPNEAGCPTFVNADLIAAGLSPFAPEAAAMRASRVMLAEIRRHARSGISFAFETTLAGRRYARMIPAWRRRAIMCGWCFCDCTILISPSRAWPRVSFREAMT